jgi:uncharacterized protein (DUF58 family)
MTEHRLLRFLPGRFAGIRSLLAGTPLSSAEPLILTQKRIFILPTKYGVTFALALLAMLLASVNYASNLGYAAVFTLLGAAAVSVLHTFANLSGLSIRPGRTEPAFAGSSCRFTLLLRDSGNRGKFSVRLASEEGQETLAARVPADRSVPLTLSRSAPCRGIQPAGKVVVSTTFPFGLFRAWSRLAPDLACVVYPRPAPDGVLVTSAENDTEERAQPDLRQPGVEEFRRLRHPERSEPYKRIDWKSYARGQGILVKDFSGSDSGALWLDFDRVSGRDAERKLSLLCRMVLEAEKEGRVYGLKLPNSIIEPSRGGEHRHRCLRALALYE